MVIVQDYNLRMFFTSSRLELYPIVGYDWPTHGQSKDYVGGNKMVLGFPTLHMDDGMDMGWWSLMQDCILDHHWLLTAVIPNCWISGLSTQHNVL